MPREWALAVSLVCGKLNPWRHVPNASALVPHRSLLCGLAPHRYVFDAMQDRLIFEMLDQLHGLLSPDGRLCLCSLTYGGTPFASAMTDAWVAVYKVSAKSMGGCRPVELLPLLQSTDQWDVEHNKVMTQLALSSQVVVAKPRVARPGARTSGDTE